MRGLRYGTLVVALVVGAGCVLDRDGQRIGDGVGGSGAEPSVGGAGGGGPACGDGIVAGDEECDGTELAGASCTDFGFTSPAGLACFGCMFDTAGCASACDGTQKEADEVCDGTDLGGQDCTDHGFALAAGLACSSTCDAYDTTGCTATCDGALIEPTEPCDGALLDGQDCTHHGYVAAAGLACNESCTDFDTLGCTAACDNGTVEPTEDCDDGNADIYDGCHACTNADGSCTQPYPIALTLGSAPQVFTGNTAAAANDISSACDGDSTAPEHVFAITADVAGFATAWLARPGTMFDTVIYARDDCAVETDIRCVDDLSGVAPGGELVSFPMIAGQTVYVVVDGYDAAMGTYELHLDLSAGTCADPVPFPVWPSSPMCALGSTVGQTHDRVESCGGDPAGDVVYRALFNFSGLVDIWIDGANSDYDSVLTVDDSCGSAFLDCARDAGAGADDLVTINSTVSGADAFLWADGFSGAEGRYELCVDPQ